MKGVAIAKKYNIIYADPPWRYTEEYFDSMDAFDNLQNRAKEVQQRAEQAEAQCAVYRQALMFYHHPLQRQGAVAEEALNNNTAGTALIARMKRMEDALKQIALEHDTWNGKTIPTVAACMARKALEVQE